MFNILFAEDEILIAADFCGALVGAGHIVRWVRSGHEAVEEFKKEKPDIILMDVKMESDFAGIDAAKDIVEINKHDKKAAYPHILFITSFPLNILAKQLVDFRFSGMVDKLVFKRTIINMLHEIEEGKISLKDGPVIKLNDNHRP